MEKLEALEASNFCRYGKECVHIHLSYFDLVAVDEELKARGLRDQLEYVKQRLSTVELEEYTADSIVKWEAAEKKRILDEDEEKGSAKKARGEIEQGAASSSS